MRPFRNAGNVSRTRREFLVVSGGVLALAGCSESAGDGGTSGSDDETTDTDGDGVPDAHDYAPRDPDVQSENDVAAPAESGSDGGTASPTPSSAAADVSYPSHAGTYTISAARNYWAWEVSVPQRFVLEYRVTNLRDENYDFDVLLYGPDRFREYRAIATEQREGIRPQYLEGSRPGTRSVAQAAVELPAGTYYLVVDNTDLSDAGDWGTEDTRQVRVEAQTRPA